MNNTTSIPNLNNHGNPLLFCSPAKWTDIAVFYLGNYVAHAATTKSKPGQSLLSTILTITMVLLFPTSGVMTGLQSIPTMPMFAATDLRTAARAGALCMVVKYPEQQRNGEGDVEGERKERREEVGGQVHDGDESGAGVAQEGGRDQGDDWLRNDGSIRLISTKIHSRCVLPNDYTLVVIPRDAEFEDDPVKDITPGRRSVRQFPIYLNYSFVKILVSIGQTIFASTTLYRTRGNQISQYGYAAFGLTVAPYAWMSLINLLGNLLCPEYPAMYLVESKSLEQLRAELVSNGNAANFPLGSTVGKITTETEEKTKDKWHRYCKPTTNKIQWDDAYFGPFLFGGPYFHEWYEIGLLVGAVPLAVYGGLSKFHQGSSTLSQRVWIMMWLVMGFAAGAVLGPIADVVEGRPVINSRRVISSRRMMRTPTEFLVRGSSLYIKLFMAIYFAAPAIGGYIAVGQMIYSYRVCFRAD